MPYFVRSSALTLAVAALTSLPLHAQSILAFRVGPSIVKFAGNGQSPYTTRSGIDAGASLGLPLTPLLGIQVGVNYAQKGARRNYAAGMSVNVDYLELPILLQIGSPSDRGFSVLVGPEVSFRTKCEVKEEQGTSQGYREACDGGGFLAISTKGLDVGLVGGIRLASAVSRRARIMLDLLYDAGLTSSIDANGMSLRNRMFTVQAGVGVTTG